MIEKTILDYLASSLEVPVYMEVPKDPPERYVIIEKTGSSRSNYISSATIALQSICQRSLSGAALLNEQVKAVMDDVFSLDDIASADLNSDYNFTDTQKKEYRYQAVYNLVHY